MGNRRQGAMALILIIGGLPAVGQEAGAPAVCPGPRDRDAGISAIYADGSRNDFTTDPGGMIRVSEPEAADKGRAGFIALSRLGLYDVEIAALVGDRADPDRRLVTVYSEPAGILPEPVQGGTWMGAMTTIWPDGSHETATAVYAFGRLRSQDFGPCRYDTIAVRASFIPWPEQGAPDGPASALDLAALDPVSADWIAQEFLYFPTLQIAVLTVTQEAGVARLKRRELTELRRLAP